MILSFMTKWPKEMPYQLAGRPTNFPEKIWESLLQNNVWMNTDEFIEFGMENLPKNYKIGTHHFKPHTIRQDLNDRWSVGMNIHFYTNARQKNMKQFAPVVKVKSIQKIHIHYSEAFDHRYASVDGRQLQNHELRQLALNDGFDSLKSFFAYFNKDFTGKLIHWTDLKY